MKADDAKRLKELERALEPLILDLVDERHRLEPSI